MSLLLVARRGSARDTLQCRRAGASTPSKYLLQAGEHLNVSKRHPNTQNVFGFDIRRSGHTPRQLGIATVRSLVVRVSSARMR